MSMSQFAIADGTQVVLGRGAVFFDRFVAGTMTKQGSKFLGNCTKLEISPATDTAEKRGSVDNTNPLIARVETSRTFNVAITGNEYLKENLALMLIGDVTEYTQTATPIVGEALGSAQKGYTFWTAKRKVTAYTVKAAAVSKTEGTDYYIDTETGAVYIIPGGSITAGQALTIDYTPTVLSAGSGLTQVNVGTAGTIIGQLDFVGNPMNGKVHELHLWKVQFLPDGALGFITDDYGEFGLQGTILSDAATAAHNAVPFGILYQR